MLKGIERRPLGTKQQKGNPDAGQAGGSEHHGIGRGNGGCGADTPVAVGSGKVGRARTEWGVEDEAVLSAIACHTAGKPGMSRLDKIVYLADMTSAERDWSGVNKLRRLERKDLDLAMLAALRQTNDFVLSQGKPLDPMSKAAYDEIKAEVDARAAKAG